MNYISAALALLQLVNKLIDWGRDKQQYNAGAQAEVTKQTVEILRKSEYSKNALAEFGRMPDGNVDDFLRSLEPPVGNG